MNILRIAGLLARHFWVSFLYLLVEIQIAFHWKVMKYSHLLRIKLIELVGTLPPLLILFTLVGCATAPQHATIAPSPIAVVCSVSSSAAAAVALGGYVQPGGEKAYTDLTNSLSLAQIAVGQYVSKVDEQSRQLTDAQNEVVYWHQKQINSLKEIWQWRLIALFTVLAVVAYIGIKTAWKFYL